MVPDGPSAALPVNVRLPSEMLDAIDNLVRRGLYTSRQEFIRQAIRGAFFNLHRGGLSDFPELVS